MKNSTVLAAAMAFGLAFHAQATDYYWIGGESSEWANSSNWSLTEGGEAASAYPNGGEDTAFFPSGASLTLNSYAKVRKIFTDGTLTLAGNGNGGIQTTANNNTAPLTIGGTGPSCGREHHRALRDEGRQRQDGDYERNRNR